VTRSTWDPILIRSGGARAEILAAHGATLSYWRLGELDILRPRAPGTMDPLDSACFPLAPFCNVIGDGGFHFAGQFFPLVPNHPQEPLPIHGDAWLGVWSVGATDDSSVLTSYSHDAHQGFPFRYTVYQRVRISPRSLSISLKLVNSDSRLFPAGLGLHPYFLKPAGARLQAGHHGVRNGVDVYSDARFLNAQSLPTSGIDECFVGWSRQARLIRSNQGIQIRVAASSSAGSLVIFSPANADFVCIEPVSNVNDGFNAMAAGSSGTGVRILGPGGSLVLATVIHLESLDFTALT
jgi:aldose 1-epimerase